MSFLDPKQNIEQFGLNKGMFVADLGAGSGFYTLESARVVGSEGRIYAIDVQKDLLDRIKSLSEAERFTNIEVIWGDLEKIGGTRLADMSVDAVIVSNILFQIENKNDFIVETKRILRPKGRALVVDWEDSFGGLGPDSNSVFTKPQAMELFEKNGFVIDREISAGDNHYGIIFRKK